MLNPQQAQELRDDSNQRKEGKTVLGLTVLGSGSKGNALVVQGESSALLIDAGFSLRELRRRMEIGGVDEGRISAILVSHEHSDHVKGLRAAARHFRVPVYCNRGTGEMIKDRGAAPQHLHLFAPGTSFPLAEFTVEPFSIPHDAMDPMGFIVRSSTCKMGIVTDLGHAGNVVCHHLRECDILVLEANHDVELLRQSQRPWPLKQRIIGRHGHLSNDASMELLQRVIHQRTRHVILAHASQDCNCYNLLEQNVVKSLSELGRHDIQPWIARQDEVLPTVWVM